MNVKRSLLFLGCSYIYCRFCFCGIDAESGPYNIAQGKPTNQGPKTYCGGYPKHCHPSEYAVDNDLSQNVDKGHCSHTTGLPSQGSWWSVDFQGKYYLSYIRILRRSDVNTCCSGERMTGIAIKELNGSHTIYNASDAGMFGDQTDVITSVPNQLNEIQFSGIKISVDGPFLTLCEVQVFLDMTRYCIVPSLQNGNIMEQNQPNASGVVLLHHTQTYKCDTGFTPFHQTHLVCTTDGLRDSANNAPSCSVTNCGELSQKPNAIWEPHASKCLNYGCSYSLVCKRGYKANVDGQMITTCDWNGEWTELRGGCDAKKCGEISEISNGQWSPLPSNPSNACLYYGCYYNLTCFTGYTVNVSGFATITCEENGQWTVPRAHCHAIKCPLEINTGVNYTITSHQEKYTYNETFTAMCKEGHELSSGDLTRFCLENGTWSGSEPVCTIVVCQRPDEDHFLINELESTGSAFYYGTFIQTACIGGYKHISGNLTRQCQANKTWSGSPVCEDITANNPAGSSSGSATVIGGATGAAVAVMTIVVVVVAFILRRRQRKNPDSKTSYEQPRSPGEENQRVYSNISQPYQEPVNIATKENTGYTYIQETAKDNDRTKEDNAPDCQVRDTPDEYYNVASCEKKSPTTILLADLADFVLSGKTATDKMDSQFKTLPTGLKQSYKTARQPENANKNRYKNMYPYDANRVVLMDCRDKSDTDYINASYINGFDNPKAYVASQGPTKDMINDFWRMVWQLDSSKIVMLTNLTEDNKMKCIQYWPDEGACKFGNITVTIRDSDIYSDFVIRTLAIKQDSSREKLVHQFHFTVWPDKGVPKFSSAIVNFRNKVKHATSRGKGPVIVHCSAGIGRTGTYIALDILTEQGKACGYVDVVRCVEEIRRQRVNMVQTLDQYIFLHTVLTEALMLSSSAIPVAKFQEVYKELLNVDPVKRKRNIVFTYEMLKHMSPVADETQYISAKEVKNRDNNRYSNILPVSDFMPRIYGSLKEIYINAVYLPSYRDNKALILTQMPLENTKSDFWALVLQHQVHTIVMMNTVAETKDGEIYWPDVGECHIYNNIEVETLEVEEIGEHTVVTMKMNDNKSEREVKQIQCRYWPASQTLPHSPSDLIRTLDLVQSLQQQSGNHPLVVHCMNGVDRSGLFCVVSAVIERLKIEQDVAITQVIEEMRLCRDQLIPSVEQFQFCHEVILTYIQQFSEYSNFSA